MKAHNPRQNEYGREGFPDRIRHYRERQFWTQKTLAEESGVSYRTIQNWEEGNSTPHPGSWQLKRVSEVLRLPPSYVLFGEEWNANY